MSRLDVAWAIEELKSFLHETDQVPYANKPGGPVVIGTHMQGSQTKAAGQAHVVGQILDRVIPTWPRTAPEQDRKWQHLREWAAKALTQLERDKELREKLGDNAPQLDASRLHPWVWEGARSLWATGHFRQALNQAAIHVNAETQAKISRRDVSETKLFQQAFSTDAPEAGKARLRLMDDDGSDTFRNVHRGAMALAEGLYAGIRNPGAHEVGEQGVEQEALEQLAAFSVLARWIDSARVLTAETSTSDV